MNMRTPDFLWNSSRWELKTIESEKYGTIDKRIRKAYSQVRDNPGGIILDFSKSALSLEEAKELALKSAVNRAKGISDIIIKKANSLKSSSLKRNKDYPPRPHTDQDGQSLFLGMSFPYQYGQRRPLT